jgi:hypothetical protein
MIDIAAQAGDSRRNPMSMSRLADRCNTGIVVAAAVIPCFCKTGREI